MDWCGIQNKIYEFQYIIYFCVCRRCFRAVPTATIFLHLASNQVNFVVNTFFKWVSSFSWDRLVCVVNGNSVKAFVGMSTAANVTGNEIKEDQLIENSIGWTIGQHHRNTYARFLQKFSFRTRSTMDDCVFGQYLFTFQMTTSTYYTVVCDCNARCD